MPPCHIRRRGSVGKRSIGLIIGIRNVPVRDVMMFLLSLRGLPGDDVVSYYSRRTGNSDGRVFPVSGANNQLPSDVTSSCMQWHSQGLEVGRASGRAGSGVCGEKIMYSTQSAADKQIFQAT